MTLKEYTEIVLSFGCIKCGIWPAEKHHIRSMAGMGQKNSDWLIVPLCAECHRTGKDAVHQNTRDERDYLSQTIEKVTTLLKKEGTPF